MSLMNRVQSMILVIRKAASRQEGVALFVSLLVTLVLVLLGITLLLISGTENLMSVNERDAADALAHGEAGLQWGKYIVMEYANAGPPYPVDLDALLIGPDAVDGNGTGDDNLLGIRDLSLGDTADINGTNEQTASAIVTRNFDDGGNTIYEAFRLGTDDDGDNVWDNERALVYVRLLDNPDDGANDQQDDTDLTVRIKVVAEYPFFVRTVGGVAAVQDTNNIVQRSQSRRILIGRVAPADQQAIIANKNLELEGTTDICGECGGVHANGDLEVGGSGDDVDICADATGSGTVTVGSTGTLNGYVGYSPPIEVPIINPYDDMFVPVPADFNHGTDQEYIDDPGDPFDAAYPQLLCTFDPVNDPGASKYYALVISPSGEYIFKAYWVDPLGTPGNLTDDRWDWRGIDDLGDGSNTILDDCGRVVSGEFPSGTALVADTPFGGRTDTAAAVDDANASEWYNVQVQKNHGTVGSCTVDDSLTGTADNDRNPNNFRLYPAGVASSLGLTLPPLPGNNPILPRIGNVDEPDTNEDFIIADCNAKGDSLWRKSNGKDVYSPLVNSVLFIYGNIKLEGNGNSLISSSGTTTLPSNGFRNIWRASYIAFGNVDTAGNVNYAPATNIGDFYYMIVAGRDVDMQGTSGAGGPLCPSPDTCGGTPTDPGGFEGIVAVHEQLDMGGNPDLDGFIVIEDAADCSDLINSKDPKLHGNIEVHYDCENPPNPWGNRTVRMMSWEEVQTQ